MQGRRSEGGEHAHYVFDSLSIVCSLPGVRRYYYCCYYYRPHAANEGATTTTATAATTTTTTTTTTATTKKTTATATATAATTTTTTNYYRPRTAHERPAVAVRVVEHGDVGRGVDAVQTLVGDSPGRPVPQPRLRALHGLCALCTLRPPLGRRRRWRWLFLLVVVSDHRGGDHAVHGSPRRLHLRPWGVPGWGATGWRLRPYVVQTAALRRPYGDPTAGLTCPVHSSPRPAASVAISA